MSLFQKEDPKESIKLQLAELAVKLAEVRKQVGELNAEYARVVKRRSDAAAKSAEFEEYAKKALTAGNQDDAKVFLAEKYKHDQKFEKFDSQLEEIGNTRQNAMELHDKMVREINEAKSRLAVLEAREATADASLKFSKTAGSSDFEQKLSGLEAEADLKAAMDDAKSYVDEDLWGDDGNGGV
ncbi:MAG: PspA/IM30 family protein [Ruminococcus sp.]|nr:PspA/IM30 family protein [Ruminococcus sp.]